MSFLSDLSDSGSEEEASSISLFSHAARNSSLSLQRSIAAPKASLRGPRSTENDTIYRKKPAKRKSKDRESDSEDEGRPHRGLSAPTLQGSTSTAQISMLRGPSRAQEVTIVEDNHAVQDNLKARITSHEGPVIVEDDVVDDSKPIPASEAEDTDDEFAEIARQARLEQRRKLTQDKEASGKPAATIPHAQLIDADPKVEILLTSELPDADPLRIYLRLSQQLGIARKAWCKRQGFADDFAESVYLTYRGHRLYDNSTCRSLGLAVDSEGHLFLKGQEHDPAAAKVHLEAVTAEWLAQEESRTNETTQAQSVLPDTSTADEVIVRVVLRSNKDDFKLKVRPTTTISKMMDAYRQKRSVPPDKNIALNFDGEELPLDKLIQDTEISDMDVIEVHLR